jgi:CHAT domain-containing protein
VILEIAHNGIADRAGLKAGDVLLEYNRKVLKTFSDLDVVPSGDKAIRVPIKLWRDGHVKSAEVAAGELGIQPGPDGTVSQVIPSRSRAIENIESSFRGQALVPLPGTRREVRAIARLFPDDHVATLLGPDASESNLQRLARTGDLKKYRFIHLATHGMANASVALSSTIFLAAEADVPAASHEMMAFDSASDGQVTAEQIVRTWDLDADLVVLSACESGLGHYVGGEGYLGFSQALFVKGARSLVLSLWKVDDRATALLMTRFYQNLLGRRQELTKPMPKATALDEAKRWLRGLRADQVEGELAALERGTERRKGPAVPRRPESPRPFEHPYYWAAFILIGNPN